MKKLLAFVLVGILIVILVGCTKDDSIKIGEKSNYNIKGDSVSLTIKEDSLNKTKATLTIENHTDNIYEYGDPFTIEKEVNGIWHELEPLIEAYFTLESYYIEAGGSIETSIDWKETYGDLPTGKYRVIKTIFANSDRGITEGDDVYIGAEFSIK